VIEAASGQSYNQFTNAQVKTRTGMIGFWFDGVYYSRPRDMARFGLLMQANGIWDGVTLLADQDYLFGATHPSQQINNSYGYLWWLNGQPSFMLPDVQIVFPGKIVPNAPDDMIAALGKNDQKIHIVPSRGLGDCAHGRSRVCRPRRRQRAYPI
jgi:CubicO group peptidase (beta-lactamase class C family)